MTRERIVNPITGWAVLILNILVYPGLVAAFIGTVINAEEHHLPPSTAVPMIIGIVLLLACNVMVSAGFIVLQPNEAGVLTLFGEYKGTAKANGFWWANPFYTKRKLSLRYHNLNSDKLKVNDKAGNPIEIGAVLVWKVEDTFAACFEVEHYADYVTVQSESAVRHLASTYPYDSWEESDEKAISLRGNIDEVSEALEKELQERLSRAGVKVIEARLTHLAYAPEIAGAMLQRQQASAIISARQKIVDGAVGMVEMALEKLSSRKIVELDSERKAQMVSNLLVVLCGERDVHPVINAGTLY
jgi:regulator of protease activity HflC (stomatin/prohibitin superfamily)